MPAGVSLGQYCRFFVAALITAFAGAQTVHMIYKPLDDLDLLVEEELERKKRETT